MATSEHTITVHLAHAADAPVVYLPVVEGDGSDVYSSCRELGCPDHTLVAIGGIDWNRELSPWQCDAITRESEPFGGEAKAFLAELEDAIAPSVEAGLDAKPRYRALAGYSLAGLFALWAATQTGAFARMASVSGSLWFPGFVDYLEQHGFTEQPQRVYLSLGKKEHKTPNRMMRNVLTVTQNIEQYVQDQNIPNVFELNPGNHFYEPTLRCARGITWLLSE